MRLEIRFDSTRGSGKTHGALDLNGALGDPVFAARDGRVAIAEQNWGAMGNTVIIDHGDGDYTDRFPYSCVCQH